MVKCPKCGYERKRSFMDFIIRHVEVFFASVTIFIIFSSLLIGNWALNN